MMLIVLNMYNCHINVYIYIFVYICICIYTYVYIYTYIIYSNDICIILIKYTDLFW